MGIKDLVKRLPGAHAAARYVVKQAAGNRVVSFTPTHNQDNLATDHWLTTNERFEAAYRKSMAAGLALSQETKWRVRTACWAAEIGQKLGGAFVECGVANGFMSRVIIDYLDFDGPFYLLDTYNGLDERYVSAEQLAGIRARDAAGRKSIYHEIYDQVVATFADRPNVHVVRGAVPETLAQVPEQPIAYLSIDMNAAIPEIAAIEYFWPMLVKGAFVVLDDYGWQGHEEQRHAFDAWAIRARASLLSLPTGQGLIVKA